MLACPYITQAFNLLSKKWSGNIIHTLSLSHDNDMSFSELKLALETITPRALSMRLNELINLNLIKKVEQSSTHTYQLTSQGLELVNALKPIETWAHTFFTDIES